MTDGDESEAPDGERPDGRRDGRRGAGAPLSDLASAIQDRERERRRGAGAADAEEDPLAAAFSEVETSDVPMEDVWESLHESGGEPTVSVTGEAAEAADVEPERDVRVIPKRTCHGCQHFADPPAVGCTHEGTDIWTVVDADRFKVVDCPVVAGTEDGPATTVSGDAGPAAGGSGADAEE